MTQEQINVILHNAARNDTYRVVSVLIDVIKDQEKRIVKLEQQLWPPTTTQTSSPPPG